MENFGPLHVDRCEAVMRRGYEVIGIEFAKRSHTYEWVPPPTKFRKITLFDDLNEQNVSEAKLLFALLSACVRTRAQDIFFCHYFQPSVLCSAVAMRTLGRGVYTMMDSKFDDMPRQFWREFAKRQFLKPYMGC